MLKVLFRPGNDSFLTAVALLVLRLWLGLTLLLNHGLAKVQDFNSLASHFADPFHIGPKASLALAVFAEVIASSLLVLGLMTRFAALTLAINLTVAFVFVHKTALSGAHSGELAFIYLAGFVALFFAGPGGLSLDRKVFRAGPKSKSDSEPKK
jgi:putative oxidoreductase